MIHKYREVFDPNKTFLPRAFALINALPGKYLFYSSYTDMRHPGSILERASDEIETQILKVLDLHQVVWQLTDDAALKRTPFELDSGIRDTGLTVGG